MFGTAFHKLAHSGPSLDAILHIEYGYAQAVQDIISRKSRQITSITKMYVNHFCCLMILVIQIILV